MTYQIFYDCKDQEGVCCINSDSEDLKEIRQQAKKLLDSNGRSDYYINKIVSINEELEEIIIYENKDYIYKKKGFENRQDYINYLSDTYNIPVEFIITLSETLGQSEDFDGLIAACMDAEYILNEEEEA